MGHKRDETQMTYHILSAVKAWAQAERNKKPDPKYDAALERLCDAIKTIQQFH